MAGKRKIRIVLDANWFVSACISSHSRRTIYYSLLRNPRVQVYYSSELVGEFNGVISRKKFAKKITAAQISRFMALAFLFLKRVDSAPIPPTSRDPNDDYLLGICQNCQANFLITGDQDLLILETFGSTAIVTMGQFLQIVPLL